MNYLSKREINVMVDMGGCPNRCRHCWLTHSPNAKMTVEQFVKIISKFKNFKYKGEKFAEKLNCFTWYREPDYLPNYKELWEIEKNLSDEPTRFDLLSIWRLARDEKYANWAKEIGTEKCQITLFGLEENTDYFYQRKGAFRDCIKATEILLEVGIVPRWQIFLNQKNIIELDDLVNLIETMELEDKCNKLGKKFEVYVYLPAPDGEAFKLEDNRLKQEHIKQIPTYFITKTEEYFNTKIESVLGIPEKDLLLDLVNDNNPSNSFLGLNFMVSSELDVYLNFGEPQKWNCLGNLNHDSLNQIFERLVNNEIVGLKLISEINISTLATLYGRQDSEFLYTKNDLITRLTRLYAEEHYK